MLFMASTEIKFSIIINIIIKHLLNLHLITKC